MRILKAIYVPTLGLLSWAIPFALSFVFFDPNGELLIPRPLFKSTMVVAGGGIGAALLVLALRRISVGMIHGLLVGLTWMALNLLVDIVFLLPIMRVSPSEYFADIGLRHVLLPIMGAAIGAVASWHRQAALAQ